MHVYLYCMFVYKYLMQLLAEDVTRLSEDDRLHDAQRLQHMMRLGRSSVHQPAGGHSHILMQKRASAVSIPANGLEKSRSSGNLNNMDGNNSNNGVNSNSVNALMEEDSSDHAQKNRISYSQMRSSGAGRGAFFK